MDINVRNLQNKSILRPILNMSILLAFLLVIVMLTGNAVISQRNTDELVHSKDRVAKTWQIQLRLQMILNALIDAETGNRGYLLTGKDKFLQPYRDAVKKMPAQIEDLDSLISTEGLVSFNANKFKELVDERFTILSQMITDRSAQEKGSYDLSILEQGKAKMDELRREIARMNRIETIHLMERQRTATISEENARNTFKVATVGAILSVCLALFIFQRLIHIRNISEESLRLSEERLTLASEAESGQIYEWTPKNGQAYRSRGLFNLTGYYPEEVDSSQEWWMEQIHSEDLNRVKVALNSILTSSSHYDLQYRVKHRAGGYRNVWDRATILRDKYGKILRIVGTSVDITDQKQAQEAIENLNARLKRAMAESHHRIKNNLQVLAAIVELQSAHNESSLPDAGLQRMGVHIRSLASLHEILTREAKSGKQFDFVSLKSVLNEILPHIRRTAGNREIIANQIAEIILPLKQSGSFALLINELVSNALKHGKGSVEISLTQVANKGILKIHDEGVGFSADFDPKKASHIGLELIDSLVKWDMHGEMTFTTPPEGGGLIEVSFPIPAMPSSDAEETFKPINSSQTRPLKIVESC